MRPFALPLLAGVLLAGCAGATFDDVYNTPDSLDWTYFSGSKADVVQAIQETYARSGIRVESIGEDADLGGTLVSLAERSGSGDIAYILVQSTTVEGYRARAQIYPGRRPLPRDLEIEISGRM